MGIEAFLWNYRDKEPIGFDSKALDDIFESYDAEWNDEYHLLRVWFDDPPDQLDFYIGKKGLNTDVVGSIMVSRPTSHPAFLELVFRIMKLGNVLWFNTDDSTPVFVRGVNINHYPNDLLKALGVPRFIDSLAGIFHLPSQGS